MLPVILPATLVPLSSEAALFAVLKWHGDMAMAAIGIATLGNAFDDEALIRRQARLDDVPVIMITAFASVESAIAAMKRGAFDYITKPFKNDEVLVVVRNAVERRRLRAENMALRQNLQATYQKFAGIIGRSSRMKQVFDLIIQAAPSRSTAATWAAATSATWT